MTSRRFLLIAFACVTIPLGLLVKGCSQFADSSPATIGPVITAQQVVAFFPGKTVIVGDQTYAEVNPAFSPKWHDYTASVMSMLGMSTKWSEQFDCNRFANVKLAVIHVRFLVDTWNARQPGQGPAAGEFWYLPDGLPLVNGARQGHAILVTIEGGRRVFRDIYSSRELTLSIVEQQSVYLIKF